MKRAFKKFVFLWVLTKKHRKDYRRDLMTFSFVYLPRKLTIGVRISLKLVLCIYNVTLLKKHCKKKKWYYVKKFRLLRVIHILFKM